MVEISIQAHDQRVTVVLERLKKLGRLFSGPLFRQV